MTFGEILEFIVNHPNSSAYREGWNGEGQHIFYFTQSNLLEPFIALYNTREETVPWTPTTTDMLAKDWIIVH